MLALSTCLHECFLYVFAPVHHAVTFDDLDLVHLVVSAVRGQPGQRLSSTATYSQEEGIAKRLSDNSMDTRHVVASIQEHNKSHLLLDCTVILFKEQFNLSLELL